MMVSHDLTDTPPERIHIVSRSLMKKRKKHTLDKSMSAINSAMGISNGSLFKSRFSTSDADQSAYVNESTFNLALGRSQFFTDEVYTTNITCLIDENPEIVDASNLHSDFLEALQSHPHDNQLLDLVSSFHRLCSDSSSVLDRIAVSAMAEKTGYSDTKGLYSCLDTEKNSWGLLMSLYKDRFESEARAEEDAMDVDLSDINYSEREVIRLLYERDSELREAQLVCDWLEGICKDSLDSSTENEKQFSSQAVAWENTRYYLETTDRSQQKSRNIISELDPDAPLRDNRQLVDIDQQDEQRFLRFLFCCIRAGDLDRAQRLCMQRGQAWRAATLEGWRLFHDPGLSPDGHSHSGEPVEGNPNRALYKSVCWKLAADERLSMDERAIYAAYSGHLESLLNVCSEWEDVLWAHLKVMIESRVDAKARALTNTGIRQSQCVTGGGDPMTISLPDAAWIPGSWGLESVFHLVDTVHRSGPASRQTSGQTDRCKEIYRAVQKAVVLGEIEGLISNLCEISKKLTLDNTMKKHILRFMAHIVLFLRRTHTDTQPEKCTSILEAYVECLIKDRDMELIAAYVATLPGDKQVEWYSKFLEDVTDIQERRRCLELAEEAGLNVARITSVVVEAIRARPTQGVVDTGPGEAWLVGDDELTGLLTDEDRAKIEAIDWLVFHPSHRAEALRQTNAICRLFLAYKKLNGAKEVIKKLPADSMDLVRREHSRRIKSDNPPPGWEVNAVAEHEALLLFLDAQDAFSEWFEHMHRGRPQEEEEAKEEVRGMMTLTEKIALEQRVKEKEGEMERWRHVLQLHTQTVSSKILAILEFPFPGWLVDPEPLREDEEEEDGRTQQLDVVRQSCIRDLTFLLVRVLSAAGDHERCVRVGDVIASEEYQHYKLFRHDQLAQLLSLFRESSLKLQDNHLDSLGYPMSN